MTDSPAKPRRPGRPPKIARPDDFDTREALIRCGVEVLTEQGFMATGIDGILKRVGVPKGSFYHYFASKEAFGLDVLNSYAGYFARRLDRWLLDETLSPLERLAGFVQHSKASMARYGYRRGCMVGNMGQEVSVLPDGFRDALEAIFLDWQLRLCTCFEAAKQAGELPRYTDCAELAAYFWISWEGAVLRARLVQSDAPLNTFIAGFLRGLPR
ncbi:TetR/AcrR family transcriptional regulator [Pseudomonas sp. NPDC088444]|uniref:acrylate utilization transcriptional regulator AcuR n=1 Tax=Pseudomonas sp. NPDC088444 TaxID=3364456 RepID=UPI00384EE9E7